MKVIQVKLPEKIAAELKLLVQRGWFADEGEIIRIALLEYIGRHRLTLLEEFQLEDIRWATQLTTSEK